MPTVLEFLRAIAEAPYDETSRQIFADWLEEQGDPRSEFLRLDSELSDDEKRELATTNAKRWKQLRNGLPPAWLMILDRAKIELCDVPNFRKICPQNWNLLQGTDVGAVRFCLGCERNVYYCQTAEEANDHAAAGHCIAVEPDLNWYDPNTYLMGIIDFEEEPNN